MVALSKRIESDIVGIELKALLMNVSRKCSLAEKYPTTKYLFMVTDIYGFWLVEL